MGQSLSIFDLVKEKTGSFPTLGTLPGITPPGETTAPKDTSTVKVKILGFNSSDRTLNRVDSLGNLRNFQIPADIPLQGTLLEGPHGPTFLPGEEIELTLIQCWRCNESGQSLFPRFLR